MVLLVSLGAILAASWVVPRPARAGWRRAWIREIWHYTTLLRERGLKNRYIRARLWHHSIGALRDAWRIRANAPGTRRVRGAMRTSAFSLGLIAFCLVAIAAFSRGLAITRSMIAPRYPDAARLVLIYELGVPLGERYAISPPLLEFWKVHNTTLAGLAGYQWNAQGDAWVTPDFFTVLGARPRRFLLHRIREWKPAERPRYLGVLGRLKPGVADDDAEYELRDLAARYRQYQRPHPFKEAEVMPLVARMRQPLYAYSVMCGVTIALLLTGALIGIRADRRRSGRIRTPYWAYYCAKSVLLPLALTLVIWEFTRATSITLTGGTTFVAEPFFVWLVILNFGGIVWWCLADQRARCRACLRTLQYPVRIGSLGAVLFDHSGTELVCCQGHGSLYVPAVSSDYVQSAGWTGLDLADAPAPPSEPVRR